MDYLITLIILYGIYGILALSLNLAMGFAGMLLLSQAAFFGLGAYVLGILSSRYQLDFWLCLPIGMLVCGGFASIVVWSFRRFRGDILAIATTGLTIIVHRLLMGLEPLTGGTMGLAGLPRPAIGAIDLSGQVPFMFLVLAVLAGCYFLCKWITQSPMGRVLRAVRQDEIVASIHGFQPERYKMLVFVVSAMMAGIAGQLMASNMMFIDPSMFGLTESILAMVLVIVGGLADLRGSVIGAILILSLPEGLRLLGLQTVNAGQIQQVLYGMILVVLMFVRPQGLLGKFKI